MIIGEFGILLAVAALGLLMNMRETVFIGAGITPATPKKKPPVGASGTLKKGVTLQKKPLVTKKTSKGSANPGAGSGHSKPSSSNQSKPSPKGKVSLSQVLNKMTPAQKNVVTQSWVIWARKQALVIAKKLIIQRQQSGYQTVGYGGFGGTDPGALGSSALQALGMSGIGIGKGYAASQSKEYQDATNHLKRFAACDDDDDCRLAEVKRYREGIAETINNTLSKHGGAKYDAAAEQVRA